MMQTQTFRHRDKQQPLLLIPPFGDLDCYEKRGPLSESYLQRIYDVLCNATTEHSRLFAFRVDLRLPQVPDYGCLERDVPSNYCHVDSRAISRFISSLQAQQDADSKRRRRLGRRVHACVVRYVWCRERDTSEQPHYHLVVLVNYDTYRRLGDYSSLQSLAGKVVKAWASALDCEADDARRLVHFPDSCEYRLNRTSASFEYDFRGIFYRASYLAKLDTKEYGTGSRSFGCSRR